MNRMTTTVFGLALIVLFCGAASAAETICVPGDYATIQAAVDNATAGDTIYVWNGTYNENVDIETSHLTLVGEGADVVTVESTWGSVFYVTADYVNITGFTLTGAYHIGICSSNADHGNISGNNVSDNDYGVYLHYSSNNTLCDNTASGNRYGVYLHCSSDNTLQGNTMLGNRYNFGVDGYALSDYTQNIDTSNTVNGRPIYYWVGQQDREIPDDAGFVGVVDSTNITVEDLVLTKNFQGVLFACTDNSRINNVTASENHDGICLHSSTDNMLTANNIQKNYHGIDLRESSNNGVICNLVCNNKKRGLLLLYGSKGNNISHNNIIENGDYNEISGGWEWQFHNWQLYDVDASDNWWGTADETSIAAGIFDWKCDPGKSNVTYLPCLDAPAPCAPGTDAKPGKFTTADAVIALEIAAGSRPFDSAADVDGDGVVTSLDALMILQVAVGGIELGS